LGFRQSSGFPAFNLGDDALRSASMMLTTLDPGAALDLPFAVFLGLRSFRFSSISFLVPGASPLIWAESI
jgi:hypothetical protein